MIPPPSITTDPAGGPDTPKPAPSGQRLKGATNDSGSLGWPPAGVCAGHGRDEMNGKDGNRKDGNGKDGNGKDGNGRIALLPFPSILSFPSLPFIPITPAIGV